MTREAPRLPRPERSYLVCATARSGSTLLCRALATTGVAGTPEEFFEGRRETGRPPGPADYLGEAPGVNLAVLESAGLPPVPDYSDLRGVGDYRDHLRAALNRGTGANGVFGAKLMWMQTGELAAQAQALPELRGLPLHELLDALFPSLGYVWVRRRDSVRQAVSLWRALQSQSWRAESDEPSASPSIEYSFAAIHHLRLRLERDDAAWGEFFERHRIQALELEYEQIASDTAGSACRVLEHLGLDTDRASRPRAVTKRQADRVSDEWVRRYDEEAAVSPASCAG
jgi:LPS sulfotransferase NodH